MQSHQPHDGGHGHAGAGSHPGMVHTPSAETLTTYHLALDAARPAPGGRVVGLELEARETEWEFTRGHRTRAWGFNGQVPGPVIEANVGDVLEVRLRNSLPEPTMIHWHGIRLEPPMDGTENVQRPVAPGEMFTYRFVLPDAGTFWYHPHMNETVQLERGLYGALIVRGADEPQLDGEQVLVLDDIALDDARQIRPPGWWIEKHDGRQGSVRLVNGRQEPELSIAGGQVERWRIVNASSARYVRLSIGGQPFRILGTDGGLIPSPVTASEVFLAPADRVDLAVGPFAEGETLQLEALRYHRGSFRRTGNEGFGTPVDHPFHLHGYFFQVLEVNGHAPECLSWEDTVNIPAVGRVKIAWMPDDRPGEWMYHCHILEHHASGMMAHFEVVR